MLPPDPGEGPATMTCQTSVRSVFPLENSKIQEECYRLILAKGGNHDLQDINGCTVAHILVVYDNMKVGYHF